MRRRPGAMITAALLSITFVACSTPVAAPPPSPTTTTTTTTSAQPTTTAEAPPTTTTTTPPSPVWTVGATPLPLRPDGFGKILPTPPVLANRSLPTKDLLPPPADGRYASTIQPIPGDVLARSTWQAACPVKSTELRYLTMSFWGFDGRPHTGEMIVNARQADGVTAVFGKLFPRSSRRRRCGGPAGRKT